MFAENRKQFIKSLNGRAAIIIGGQQIIRNGDVHYNFRQLSNFYYLTGFDIPNAIIVLLPKSSKPFVIFTEVKSSNQALWDGPSPSPKAIMKKYGANAVYDISQFQNKIKQLLKGEQVIYCNKDQLLPENKTIRSVFNNINFKKIKIIDPSKIFTRLRTRKSKKEIDSLQKATSITSRALLKTVRSMQAGMSEFQLQAIYEGESKFLGAQRQGFPPIIASGANACTLHYIANNANIKKSDLILFDIGAEHEYYTADISRTIPVNGKFTKTQAQIYQIVLDAQNKAIDAAQPGNTLGDVHLAAVSEIYNGLKKLKIIKRHFKDLSKQYDAIKKFFPHATSHWLGLDVHDDGLYSKNKHETILMPGMVITVEPGLYFQTNFNIDKKYKGIGVRIEDDILITQTGNKNLSAQFPREIEEIEKILQK